MTDSSDAPIPYRVVYSDHVRNVFRELSARAWASGQGPVFVAAVKELDRLLHIYPQFGEPLIDLAHEPGQIWHGTIRPLVVRYAIYEERRLVIVAISPLLLPRSGF